MSMGEPRAGLSLGISTREQPESGEGDLSLPKCGFYNLKKLGYNLIDIKIQNDVTNYEN